MSKGNERTKNYWKVPKKLQKKLLLTLLKTKWKELCANTIYFLKLQQTNHKIFSSWLDPT